MPSADLMSDSFFFLDHIAVAREIFFLAAIFFLKFLNGEEG